MEDKLLYDYVYNSFSEYDSLSGYDASLLKNPTWKLVGRITNIPSNYSRVPNFLLCFHVILTEKDIDRDEILTTENVPLYIKIEDLNKVENKINEIFLPHPDEYEKIVNWLFENFSYNWK